MSEYVIIVAGGIGTRMKSNIPKQFLLLNGLPILMHTITAFKDYRITLVLPEDQHSYWQGLCKQHNFNYAHDIISGGVTRFQSVSNGLKNIPDEGKVAIHDGVRPLVTKDIIKNSFELAGEHGNAITAIPLKDSIRKVSIKSNKAVDRTNYRLIQTPQTFDITLIKKAYQTTESSLFTDDASVLEKDGHKIHLFEGSPRNIKITTPEDIKIAEALIGIEN
jgi:2-C-methyl-D-erythritol 4-phosphate cytidylyltransferase